MMATRKKERKKVTWKAWKSAKILSSTMLAGCVNWKVVVHVSAFVEQSRPSIANEIARSLLRQKLIPRVCCCLGRRRNFFNCFYALGQDFWAHTKRQNIIAYSRCGGKVVNLIFFQKFLWLFGSFFDDDKLHLRVKAPTTDVDRLLLLKVKSSQSPKRNPKHHDMKYESIEDSQTFVAEVVRRRGRNRSATIKWIHLKALLSLHSFRENFRP